MLYTISRWIARLLFPLYFRLTVIGLDNVPQDGAYILVANHESFLDPLLICTVSPRIIHYITFAFFYYHPAIHWYCKRVHCIPIKKEGNDISALKRALRLFKDGEIVGIFPEGQRSATGELGPGEPGTALLALKAKVPILPVGIQGTYESFPRSAKFPKPGPVTLRFGTPFLLHEAIEGDGQSPEAFQRQATDLIMTRIADLCKPLPGSQTSAKAE
ncbi:hypothetical protein GF339_21860 [candidate division KSB3 bacterium]|uniref:Phospholipid/glycerol acyltransferase domain-containing protein n=1 Tax=candidate division KSB3 bacterium TaxID=2044937 RepID=A0A9D5JZT3_9BACT|nr:hypothetical protein [candidate division KSB3 bacterium]MBD3327248.1 hypothetical protein [candidate division KSB3 bacterium]